jgi:excinuclease ABC subunit B
LPEVSLVAILDADKEGFLRSARSLIQTIGRAARNVRGKVLLYADQSTDSIREAVEETDRRREIQAEYNREHGITPESVESEISSLRDSLYEADYVTVPMVADSGMVRPEDVPRVAAELREEMREAAAALDFEHAAEIRDRLRALESGALLAGFAAEAKPRTEALRKPQRPRRGRGR